MVPLEDESAPVSEDVRLAATHEAGHIELNAAKGRLFTKVELWHNSQQGWVGRVAFEEEDHPEAVTHPVLGAVDTSVPVEVSPALTEAELEALLAEAELPFRDELAALAAGFGAEEKLARLRGWDEEAIRLRAEGDQDYRRIREIIDREHPGEPRKGYLVQAQQDVEVHFASEEHWSLVLALADEVLSHLAKGQYGVTIYPRQLSPALREILVQLAQQVTAAPES